MYAFHLRKTAVLLDNDCIYTRQTTLEVKIMDFLYLGCVLLFFALSWGLVVFCERLQK
jgi:hypothetical protein